MKSITPELDIALLVLIRMTALREPRGKGTGMGFPEGDLLGMSLRSLLALIRVFAKLRTIADNSSQLLTEGQVISEAAHVLADWPRNFTKLLEELGQKVPDHAAGGVAKQFNGIYRGLFRNRAIDKQHTDFLRSAFLSFVMNDWGRGYVDNKLIKQFSGSVPKRFLTQTDFATRMGVRQVTVARWLAKSHVFANRVKCGRADRILVDVTLNTIRATTPGKILRKRNAAKLLGISVSVLDALKKAGIYEVRNLPPTRAGFHELDLNAFCERFFALGPQITTCLPHAESTRLASVLSGRHESILTKIRFVRAVLDGQIPIVGNPNQGIGGLLTGKSVCEAFIRDVRATNTE